jgi:hypothetical protein
MYKSVCMAAALALAPMTASAQQRPDNQVLVLYGTVLCGTGQDALVMWNRLDIPESCHGVGPNWGTIRSYDRGSGKPLVVLDNGDRGYVADVHLLMTCREMLIDLRLMPSPPAGAVRQVAMHCPR